MSSCDSAYLLSVIIPTLGQQDRAERLRRAIASVRRQVDDSCQAIVVVDGSQCPGWLVEQAGEIELLHLDRKRGKSAAVNRGFERSRAEWVMVLDDDDELFPGLVSKVGHALADPDTKVCYADFIEREYPAGTGCFERVRYSEPFDAIRLLVENYIPQPALLTRRQAWASVGGFDELLEGLEDWDFFRRLSFAYDFTHVGEIVGAYERRLASPSRSSRLEERLDLLTWTVNRILSKRPQLGSRTPTATLLLGEGAHLASNLTFARSLRVPREIIMSAEPSASASVTESSTGSIVTWWCGSRQSTTDDALAVYERVAAERRTPGWEPSAGQAARALEFSLVVGYLGWLGHENLGDEAGFEWLRRHLRTALGDRVELVPFHDAYRAMDFAVVGGGTLLSQFGRRIDQQIAEVRAAGVPYAIFGTGVEQPDLPSVVDWPELHPGPASTALLRQNLEQAELVAVRDKRSLDVLREAGVDTRSMSVMGDPVLQTDAFSVLCAPSAFLPSRGVGVNVGTSFGNIYGRDEDAVLDAVREFIDHITDSGFRVYLFSVWPADLPSQTRLARACRNRALVFELDHMPDYRSLVSTLRKMDMVIGMKLHAVVFGVLAGTPSISIAYREKCEAVMDDLGLRDWVVRSDHENLVAELQRLFLRAMADWSDVRDTVRSAVERRRRSGASATRRLISCLLELHRRSDRQ